MLTAVVQNDSEALCDQRVLEYCGEGRRKEYGEMLLSMSKGKRQNPIKTGTSNMASSYRNMKTRIRRIGEFRRVPEHIGFVTLCITLMLAAAGISSSAEEAYSFPIPEINSRRDLEKALLYARCYHAHTPEEAVYLFLRACEESNLIYRMAVMPEEAIPRYEEFAVKWFENGDALTWADLDEDMPEPYPAYLPETTGAVVLRYDIYNLQYDDEKGSAVVCAAMRGTSGGRDYAEWKLELAKEGDGWKVWLVDETGRIAGEYRPEPLLYGSESLGDFRVEVSCYNEGYFSQLGKWNNASFTFIQWSDESRDSEAFPTSLSMEYKCQSVYVTYLGEESLEGHVVNVVVADREGKFEAEVAESASIEERYNAMAEAAGAPAQSTDGISGLSGGSSDGSGYAVFDGGDLMNRAPKLVSGGGAGFSEAGWGWKADDSARTLVRIYVDGVLVEEGEVWSEKR